MVNVHFSLLPRWRGAAPVERALLAGDDVTGVCIMDVEEGLDTGGVYARREVPIGPRDDGRRRCARELVDAGTELLVDVLSRPLGAPDAAARRRHVRREDPTRSSWSSTGRPPAVELDRWVRVGGAWTTFRGRRLKVLAATPSRSRRPTPGRWATTPSTVGHGRRRRCAS